MANTDYCSPEIPTEAQTQYVPQCNFVRTEPQSPCDWNKDSRYSSFYFSFFETRGEMTSEPNLRKRRSANDLFSERKNVIKELDKIRLELKSLNKKLANELSSINEKNDSEILITGLRMKKEKKIDHNDIFLEDPKCSCSDFCHVY